MPTDEETLPRGRRAGGLPVVPWSRGSHNVTTRHPTDRQPPSGRLRSSGRLRRAAEQSGLEQLCAARTPAADVQRVGTLGDIWQRKNNGKSSAASMPKLCGQAGQRLGAPPCRERPRRSAARGSSASTGSSNSRTTRRRSAPDRRRESRACSRRFPDPAAAARYCRLALSAGG
jgi:hypothetical protein